MTSDVPAPAAGPNLQAARDALEAGRLADAETQVQAVLAKDADCAEAWRLLAMLTCHAGRWQQAQTAALRGLELERDDAQAYYILARALKGSGDLAGAERAYRDALARQPDYPEALVSLAVLLRARGAAAEALPMLQLAARLRPTLHEAHYHLGVALAERRLFEQAVAAFRIALRHNPAARATRLALAAVLIETGAAQEALDISEQLLREDPNESAVYSNLGLALRALHRDLEAAQALRRACELAPQDAYAWSNLGLARQWLDDSEAAEACFRRAMVLAPSAIEPLINLAGLLDERGRFEASASLLRAMVDRHPDVPMLLSNLGVRLLTLGRPDEALHLFEQALAREPSLHSARLSAAAAHLLRGEYATGWAMYQARWHALPALAATRPRHAREWEGEALSGDAVLVYAEQGLGDTLQFVRYVRLLAARGARVLLLVQAPLKSLLRSVEGVDSVHAFGEPLPPVAWQVALLSLPHLLGTTLDSVPAHIPYLRVDERQRDAWARRLAAPRGLRVGLVWAGDPRPHDRHAMAVDRRRSISLSDCAPLWSVAGVQWYSLQKGTATRQSRDPALPVRMADYTDRLYDFADTAALVLNLDLVISVDTSVVHLAGALGKPVWLLSRFDGCWRWLLDRDDSPWYPTLRIFRQAVPLQWRAELERVATALAEVVSARSTTRRCETKD